MIRKVHPELEAVCMRAMSKKVEDRYQSAREMRRAVLTAVGAGAPVAAAALPAPTPTHGMQPVPARPRFATSTAPGEIVELDGSDDTDCTPMPVEKPLARRRRGSLVAFAVIGMATVALSAVVARRPGEGIFGSREVHSTTVALAPEPQSNSVPIAPQSAPQPPAPATIDQVPPAATRKEPVRAELSRQRRAPSTTKRTGESSTPAPTSVSAPVGEPEPVAPVAEAAAPLIVETLTAPAPSPPPRAQTPVVEAAPPAAPVAVDPTRASVTIGTAVASSGISGSKVRTAMAHAPLAACYKAALAKRGSGVTVQSTLKIDIDLSGHVVGASLSDDGNLPGLRACVEAAARGVTVRDVDTGDGSATINLTFSPQ
jgi:hypothetical protein